jgi:hypothetical protein
VDVWFWVTEFPPSQSTLIVPPKAGSRTVIGQHSVELTALQGGRVKSDDGGRTGVFKESSDEHATEVHARLKIQYNEQGSTDRYARVAVVTLDGQRYFSDFVMRFSNINMDFSFPMRLSDIDHFEVLPIGQERSFYFDGVRLPKRSGSPLNAKGVLDLEVKTNGKSGSFASDMTAPIYAKITVLPGAGASSFSSRAIGEDPRAVFYQLEASEPFLHTDTHSTITCVIRGLSSRMLKTEFLDLSGDQLKSGEGCSMNNNIFFSSTLANPASQIQGVRIRMSRQTEK